MRKKLIGVLIATVLPVLIFAGVVSAQTFRSGDAQSIPANETVDGSAWLSGSNVDIAGTIEGDLYCAGQNITISGQVRGDILCAAQTITVSGIVDGDARIAGQTIVISSDIKGNVTAAGQTISLDSQGKIGRDGAFFGQHTTINGQIGRDVFIASNTTAFNAGIGRNVTVYAEKLTVNSSSVIGGFLTYTSQDKANISNDARIAGKVTHNEYDRREMQQRETAGFGFAATLVWSLMLVMSALLFALLFPRELHTTTNPAFAAFPNMLFMTLTGLIAGILMPFIFLLLFITILGIPFALVMIVAWLLVLMLSGAVSAYYIGRIVWRAQTNAILIMLVGAAIIAILLMIPLINVLVVLLTVWYGSGAILLRLKDYVTAPHYDMASLSTTPASATASKPKPRSHKKG